MTKKEQDLQSRLLDLLEANTKVMGTVYDLLIKMSNPLIHIASESAGAVQANGPGSIVQDDDPPAPAEPPPKTPSEMDDVEITEEYCRKALKAIGTKLSKEDAKAFLAKFGGAKTIPPLDKKHYEAFIAEATKLMEDK